MRELEGEYIEDIFVKHLSEERKLERLRIVEAKLEEECKNISHKDVHILFVRRLLHESMLLQYEGIKTWTVDITADEDAYTMDEILNQLRREDASIHERLCMIELYVEKMKHSVYFKEGLTATLSDKEPETDSEYAKEMIKILIMANGGRENRYYVKPSVHLITAKEAYNIVIGSCQERKCDRDLCIMNAVNSYTNAVTLVKSYLRDIHINNKQG